MARPNRTLEVEKEHGEPLETLLPRVLNETGNMKDAAIKLGMAFDTLYRHCKRLGIERRVIYARVGQPETDHATH